MPKKRSKRSWLILRPMSSFNSGSERSSLSSLNYMRKSTFSDYTYTEPDFSNYKHNKTHQNLNLNLLVSHLVYYINIPGRVSRSHIKVKQSSLFKIFLLIKKPWNTIFELLKLNFSQDNTKSSRRGSIAIYNKLLNGAISFYHVKFIKTGNEIDICNNSLIEIIRKINNNKFEIGEFLDIIITNEKLRINTPFHQLISRKSLNFAKNKYKKSKTVRAKKLTFDENDLLNEMNSREIVFDDIKIDDIKENEMMFDERKLDDKKDNDIIEEKIINNKEDNEILDEKKLNDNNNKEETLIENKKKGKKISKKKKQKINEENKLKDKEENDKKTIEENKLNDKEENNKKTIEEKKLIDKEENNKKTIEEKKLNDIKTNDEKIEENKLKDKNENDEKSLKDTKKIIKKKKKSFKEKKLNNVTNENKIENNIENKIENNIENKTENKIKDNTEYKIENKIENKNENKIENKNENNITNNRESEKIENEDIINKRENVVDIFKKKERIKRKKQQEEFPFEAKPKENTALSAVNIPISHHKPNKSISFFNKDKSVISQDDLDELRKDLFERPITIRRVIYKVTKKRKKIQK